MSSGQGWFESDDDYQDRMECEANESTIESATGDAPSQGLFESDNGYAARIADEANESIIESGSGEAPTQGWLESDEAYTSRVEEEANIASKESLTGESSRQGLFESDESYNTRVRREANEAQIEHSTENPARQGWFEGEHDYRSRINHEGNILRASRGGTANTQSGGAAGDRPSYSNVCSTSSLRAPSSKSHGVGIWGVLLVIILTIGIAVVWREEGIAREQRLDRLIVDAKNTLRARKFEEAHAKFEIAIQAAQDISTSRVREVRKIQDSLYWRGTISPSKNISYSVQGRLFYRFDNPLKCRSNPRSCGYRFRPQDKSLFYTPSRSLFAKNRSGKMKALKPYLAVNDFTDFGVDYCCERTEEEANEKIVFFNRGNAPATLYLLR